MARKDQSGQSTWLQKARMKSRLLGSAGTSFSMTWCPPGFSGMVIVTVPHETLDPNNVLITQGGTYRFLPGGVAISASAGSLHR